MDRALNPDEEYQSRSNQELEIGTIDYNLVTQTFIWNDALTVLLGYTPGAVECSEENWVARVHHRDLDRVRATLDRATIDRTEYSVEYRIVGTDGYLRWLSQVGRFEYDRVGQPLRMTGIIRDITAYKRTELALKQSQDRMTLALDGARMGIFDWNLQTQQVTWNDRHFRLLGYVPRPLATYADWENRVHPEDLARVRATIDLARTTSTDYNAEYRVIWEDGTIRWLQGFGRFYYSNDGEPLRMSGVIYDITERVESAVAVRESEERFRNTFEQAAVGIAHVGLDGRWLSVNRKLCEIVGYPAAELANLTFQDITYPADLATDLAYVRQLLAGEIDTYTMEKRYISKLGRIVWVNLTVSLRRDTQGAPLHFISVVEQIDDRKQAELEIRAQSDELAKINNLLQAKNQELDRFAHIISHDLKAPLRAITNLSEWIEEDLTEQLNPDSLKNLELLRSRVQRMDAMIEGILQYSRVGRIGTELETFCVENLLAEIVASLSIPASFTIDLPTALPPLFANRVLVERVLTNLIANAYKHHDRTSGNIRVTAHPQPDRWEFTVTDDGVGIPPECQERVFEIFQTLAGVDKGNTGIGLSIVKKIVENQGGNVIIESPIAAGRGTTFRVDWKLA
jgi:PAS domain S-box-containing protein